MGLSIHYKGRFKRDATLLKMIDEVKNIAETYQWKYHIFETEFDSGGFEKDSYGQNIYGITYSPPECEPIDLMFLSNGRMTSLINLEFHKNDEDYLYSIHSKTQYAGVEVHKIIIDLFRYLSEKYFDEFELIDESQYWETGDDTLLRQNFMRYNNLMDQFGDKLNNTTPMENGTIESYVERVANTLNLKRKL